MAIRLILLFVSLSPVWGCKTTIETGESKAGRFDAKSFLPDDLELNSSLTEEDKERILARAKLDLTTDNGRRVPSVLDCLPGWATPYVHTRSEAFLAPKLYMEEKGGSERRVLTTVCLPGWVSPFMFKKCACFTPEEEEEERRREKRQTGGYQLTGYPWRRRSFNPQTMRGTRPADPFPVVVTPSGRQRQQYFWQAVRGLAPGHYIRQGNFNFYGPPHYPVRRRSTGQLVATHRGPAPLWQAVRDHRGPDPFIIGNRELFLFGAHYNWQVRIRI